jgi:hypothetical protein
VPEGRKNLVYELPPREGTTATRQYATEIPSGRTKFQFDADKSARQVVEDEAPQAQEDARQQGTTAWDETGSESEQETDAASQSGEGATAPTPQLDASQLHWVKQQISLALAEVYDDFSDALDHLKQTEIEPLRQELYQHLTQHAPIPRTPIPETPVPETPVPETPVPETPVPETPVPETPVPETPTTLEAAIDLAVELTADVLNGFTAVADAFAARLGLGLEGGGATEAERTLKQLRLAASAAGSAIARYESLPTPSAGSEEFAVIAFVAEVRTAGEFYATTVARVAQAATRTGDPGEEAAYDEVVRTLGSDPTGSAIDGLRRFDVGTASGTSNRRRFTS